MSGARESAFHLHHLSELQLYASPDESFGPPDGITLGGTRLRWSEPLKSSLEAFLKSARRRLLHHRPSSVSQLAKQLRPLSEKADPGYAELSSLIDTENALRMLAQQAGHHAIGRKARDLARQIGLFLGDAPRLRAGLIALSSRLERQATVASFARFVRAEFPHCVRYDNDRSEHVLNDEGIARLASIQKRFERTCRKRHVIPVLDGQQSQVEKAVVRIIGPECGHYQNALRSLDVAPDDATARKRLIECAEIVDSLATAHPEHVRKTRFASHFPGGLADPALLTIGQCYEEPGFLFVGGERARDAAFKMEIELCKGFPVDAGQYYGHGSTGAERKMQWISLPGASFQFDGIRLERAVQVYLFKQIPRSTAAPQMSSSKP